MNTLSNNYDNQIVVHDNQSVVHDHQSVVHNNQGVVYKKVSGSYDVYTGGRMVSCGLASRLRKQGGTPQPAAKKARNGRSNPGLELLEPVVGDEVRFVESQDGSGTIVEVLPRQNKLARRGAVPMPSAHAPEQVIAANVGQVVPVFAAANPVPKWNLLDRYLVSAEAADLPALICITKLDLVQDAESRLDEELSEVVADYHRIGYPVVLVSSLTGEGLDELAGLLAGRISVLLGKSGVGKTSLLNALEPGLGLRVNAVSQVTGKGKHTTTHQEMFPLKSGGAVVDTPGVREFGLWDVESDDLALFFPEMRPFVGQCRFGMDCQHDEEPGCEVRQAVAAGQISPRRYFSYLRLRMDG